MTMACQLVQRSGEACGVDAIGRCIDCERAFCGSHQAISRGLHVVPFVNLCRECSKERARVAEEDVARQQQDRRDRSVLAERQILEVVSALVSMGSPGLQPRRRTTREAKRAWSKQLRVIDLEPGWNVGEFTWKCTYVSTSDLYGTDGYLNLATAVLPSGEVVRAEINDWHIFDERLDFLRTAEQLESLVGRLRSFLLLDT